MINIRKATWSILFIMVTFAISCSKETDILLDGNPEEDFLKLTAVTKTNQNTTVLYSDWLLSGFPNSSANSSEIWNLPLIKNSFFNPEKDVLLVYGRRGTIFTLPMTLPQSAESYIVELIAGKMGTTTRLRVTSLDLSSLQDIFFQPGKKA